MKLKDFLEREDKEGEISRARKFDMFVVAVCTLYARMASDCSNDIRPLEPL